MIQTGDRVRIVRGSSQTAPYVGSEGTVVRTYEVSDAPYTHYVELTGDIGRLYFLDELELIESAPTEPQLVHTSDITVVWVTIPGADRSYALSEDQARLLLRQLEEVV